MVTAESAVCATVFEIFRLKDKFDVRKLESRGYQTVKKSWR